MTNDHQPAAELNCTAEKGESLNTAGNRRTLGHGAAPGALVDISSVDMGAIQHQYLASIHRPGSRCFARSIGKRVAIDLQLDSVDNAHHFDIVGVAAVGNSPATDFLGCMMFEEWRSWQCDWTGSVEDTHCYPRNSPGLPC